MAKKMTENKGKSMKKGGLAKGCGCASRGVKKTKYS